MDMYYNYMYMHSPIHVRFLSYTVSLNLYLSWPINSRLSIGDRLWENQTFGADPI